MGAIILNNTSINRSSSKDALLIWNWYVLDPTFLSFFDSGWPPLPLTARNAKPFESACIHRWLHKISYFPFHTSDNLFVGIKTYSSLFLSYFCIMIFLFLFLLYLKHLRYLTSPKWQDTSLSGWCFCLANKRWHIESNNLFILYNFI